MSSPTNTPTNTPPNMECGICGSDHIQHFAQAAVDWCTWCGAICKDSWSAWKAPRGKK